MAPQERMIAALLSSGESYGLALHKAARSTLARGSVYVVLSRMRAKGLVSSRPEPRPEGDEAPPRVLYQLTPKGREELAYARRVDEALAPLLARRRRPGRRKVS